MSDSEQRRSVNILQTAGDKMFLQLRLLSISHSKLLVSAMLFYCMCVSRDNDDNISIVLM